MGLIKLSLTEAIAAACFNPLMCAGNTTEVFMSLSLEVDNLLGVVGDVVVGVMMTDVA